MRTITATIATLGFVGAAVLAATGSASAQVAFDRPDAYSNAPTYNGVFLGPAPRNVGPYAYERAPAPRVHYSHRHSVRD